MSSGMAEAIAGLPAGVKLAHVEAMSVSDTGHGDLIATMPFEPENGLGNVEAPLAQLKAEAEAGGFSFDRHAARNELQAATFRLRDAAEVRLAVAPSGGIAIEITPLLHMRDGV